MEPRWMTQKGRDWNEMQRRQLTTQLRAYESEVFQEAFRREAQTEPVWSLWAERSRAGGVSQKAPTSFVLLPLFLEMKMTIIHVNDRASSTKITFSMPLSLQEKIKVLIPEGKGQ